MNLLQEWCFILIHLGLSNLPIDRYWFGSQAIHSLALTPKIRTAKSEPLLKRCVARVQSSSKHHFSGFWAVVREGISLQIWRFGEGSTLRCWQRNQVTCFISYSIIGSKGWNSPNLQGSMLSFNHRTGSYHLLGATKHGWLV